MSAADTLNQIATSLQSPTVTSLEAMINEIADVAAVAIPGAAPAVAILKTVEGVASEIGGVASQTAVTLTAAATAPVAAPAPEPVAVAPVAAPAPEPVAVAPVAAPAPEPVAVVAPVAAPAPEPVDNASIAAASIAANPTADPLVSRIEALESGLLSMIPIIATIAKQFGL